MKEEEEKDPEAEKKNKIAVIVVLVIILSIIGGVMYSHQSPNASEGTFIKYVNSELCLPVEGAVVTIATDDCGNNIYATETTDESGKAVFEEVPWGTYYVNVSYSEGGQTYYSEDGPWEEIDFDESMEMVNFLKGYPPPAPDKVLGQSPKNNSTPSPSKKAFRLQEIIDFF